jgi:hypothetical protein
MTNRTKAAQEGKSPIQIRRDRLQSENPYPGQTMSPLRKKSVFAPISVGKSAAALRDLPNWTGIKPSKN